MNNKGFHYDGYRERFYFAGGRCFYWIDKEDLDEVYFKEDEIGWTNIEPKKEMTSSDEGSIAVVLGVVGIAIAATVLASYIGYKKYKRE